MDKYSDGDAFTENCSILRIEGDSASKIDKPTAREYPLTIIFNGTQLVTMLCLPDSLKELAVGFLSSEGFLHSKDEIKSVIVDNVRGVVRIETFDGKEVSQDTLSKRVISTGCGRGMSFYSASDAENKVITSKLSVTPRQIFDLTLSFQHASVVYKETHAVHSAALCRGNQIVAHAEDVGRHNAVDKIFGHCLLEGIQIDDCFLITSGRVSSEIAHKVVKKGIPILVSISSPTNLAVQVADRMGVTLIASVRGGKMDVYTHDWRIFSKNRSFLVAETLMNDSSNELK